MVTISMNGSAIHFEFEGSSRYLYGDGSIDCPVNSLSLILDESDLITLTKSASNDPFISFLVSESNFASKDEFLQWYKENMVGATGGSGSGSTSGVTEEEVAEMIGDALEDYYTSDEIDAGFSAVTDEISAAVSGKADTSAVTASITAAVSGKQDALDYYSEENNNGHIVVETNGKLVGIGASVGSYGLAQISATEQDGNSNVLALDTDDNISMYSQDNS